MKSIAESADVTTTIARYRQEPGALLPILHALQNQFGYIPPESVSAIADALQQTTAEIHGVITFYHQFRTTPPGKHRVQICRAEACQARGSRDLEAHAKASLGVEYHHTTADEAVTLDAVYCLGNCATGPNIRIDNQLYGRVSATRFDALIQQLLEEASV